MAALLTSTSIPPASVAIRAKAAAIEASSARSISIAMWSPPSAAAVSFSAAASRSARITRSPSAAKRAAIAAPMPLAAPVTSTLRRVFAASGRVSSASGTPSTGGCASPGWLKDIQPPSTTSTEPVT